MSERAQGIVAGCVFVLAGALALAVARTIPTRMPVGIDSGVMPEIFAAGLLGCGALLAALSVLTPGPSRGGEGPRNQGRAVVLGLNIALVVVYVGCLRYLGFILSSALHLFLQIALLDDRRPTSLLRHAGFAVITTALIWALLERGFGLILPSGTFG